MSIQSDRGLLQAYEFLKTGDPARAKPLLEDALADDLENGEILFTVRCVNYWTDRIADLATMDTPFERGESLILHWKQFITIVGKDSPAYERSMYAVRKGIFSLALENYQALCNEHNPSQKAEIFRKTGLCYKKLGEYETALSYLGEANTLVSGSPLVLAEMADCYALCGQDRNAKVLFREAFFIDAQKIDIQFLDSELINCLIESVSQKGFSGAVMQEWIPVYGVLYGVFNIKRELRAQEVGRLKQAIYALENELKDASSEPDIVIPRLINHYFWLIDHYVTVNAERAGINETLLKIKLLDIDVYDKYTM
ncbi:hypothetical protein [Treponema brennaborense]|uniref:TPR domain-containing protein n=1 Tax=Treponema brennaborense (strain DSM 12168 / CIP 105900 / DD5/3) TaxID=906968 RepID=F4LQE4_TREBD|nr:hypothetical protein [Treponema brennaborense]AEE17153.1 TPR domain-containing protein [Treponema brennaborense DSM 12168]